MGKDPAVLFYTSDFITGTVTMSNEQRGKYIILLCLQHQQGNLYKEDMLNICKTYDKKIFDKFKKTSKGLYYNERMKNESERRRKYSESRSKNRKKTCKTYDKHMETETEDVIITKDVTKRRKRKPFKKPTIKEVRQYFKDNGYKEDSGEFAWNYYNDADWFDSFGKPVLNWKQKMRSVWFKEENKEIRNILAL